MEKELLDEETVINYLKQFISFENDGKPFFQEIRKLVDNVIWAFYQINPQIKSDIEDAEIIQNFSKEIKYICDGCAMHNVAEICSDEKKYIKLFETFLPMFWSLCYFVYVSYNFGYAEKVNKGTYNGKIEFDSDLLKTAANVWDFGKNLRYKSEVWPENLPKPLPDVTDEIILHVNSLFVYGVSFILYHEIGHLLKYHLDGDPCIDHEKQADEFAVETCLKADQSIIETVKYGMILSLIAICLLDPSAGRDDEIHPNSDDRLQNALSKMNLKENDNAWMIASFGLIIWFTDFKFDFSFEREYNTAKDYFNSVLTKFRNNFGD